MGAACCVASKDKHKTIQSGSTTEILQRNIRHSPTWSFRWDHRRRVAGEDTSINWLSDGVSQNDGTEDKNDSANKPEDGITMQNNQRHVEQKLPISEGTSGHARALTLGNFHVFQYHLLLLGVESCINDFIIDFFYF